MSTATRFGHPDEQPKLRETLAELPDGQELEDLYVRCINVIRETKSVLEVCLRTKIAVSLLRELRRTHLDFQEAFDMAYIGRVIPRWRVGGGSDEVDVRLRVLKNDGSSRKAVVQLTPEMWEELCSEIKATGSMAAGARRLSISTNQLKDHMARYEELRMMVEEAKEEYLEGLREAARKRAVEGTLRPILGGKDRDKVVAHEVIYSDRLLELELKRHDPGYRDHRVVEQTGSVQVKHSLDLGALSPQARRLLKDFLLQVKEDRRRAQAALEGRTIEVAALPAPTMEDSKLLESIDAEDAELVGSVLGAADGQ